MAKRTYTWTCPKCGGQCQDNRAWVARQRGPCLACIRKSTGWSCRDCGSTDPHHQFPHPEEASR